MVDGVLVAADRTFRPNDPERTLALGVRTAAATTGVLAVSAALDGSTSPLAVVLLAISALAALIATTPRAQRLVEGHVGWGLLYAWSGVGTVFLLIWMVANGDGPLPYVGVVAVALVSAAASFPRRGAVAMILLGTVTLGAAWALAREQGPGVHAAVATGLLLIAALSAVRETSLLATSLERLAEARGRATVRNRLLTLTGRTVSLDLERVANELVDAAVELGFPIASVSIVAGDYRLRIATRGFDASQRSARVTEGLSGQAIEQGTTVWVDAYDASPRRVLYDAGIGTAVAVPIGDGERAIGALLGARAERGEPSAEDVAVLEVLAEHARHAFDNATRYRAEVELAARATTLETLKRSLLSNVTHDLRTPLASVRGLADTLRLRGDQLDEQMSEQLLGRIDANVERLTEMVHGLLELRPADTAARPTVELREIVTACHGRLEQLLVEHDVSLQVPGGLVVRVEARLLDHVLENLLSNAAKYTPRGSRIAVTAEPIGGAVRVSVADDGPGIPPEHLPLVTQQFWRAPEHRTVPGTGLGLSLVDAMLAEHGSRLEVTSSDAGGARFSFVLPLVSTEGSVA